MRLRRSLWSVQNFYREWKILNSDQIEELEYEEDFDVTEQLRKLDLELENDGEASELLNLGSFRFQSDEICQQNFCNQTLITKRFFVSKRMKAKSILEGGNNKLVLSYQSLRDLGYSQGGHTFKFKGWTS